MNRIYTQLSSDLRICPHQVRRSKHSRSSIKRLFFLKKMVGSFTGSYCWSDDEFSSRDYNIFCIFPRECFTDMTKSDSWQGLWIIFSSIFQCIDTEWLSEAWWYNACSTFGKSCRAIRHTSWRCYSFYRLKRCKWYWSIEEYYFEE